MFVLSRFSPWNTDNALGAAEKKKVHFIANPTGTWIPVRLGQGLGSEVKEEALKLKRDVESAVLKEHPEWIDENQMGENVLGLEGQSELWLRCTQMRRAGVRCLGIEVRSALRSIYCAAG